MSRQVFGTAVRILFGLPTSHIKGLVQVPAPSSGFLLMHTLGSSHWGSATHMESQMETQTPSFIPAQPQLGR